MEIDRNKVVKYLGVYIDKNLNWSGHIKELLLQLAKCCSLLYQLREYVTTETLHMLYYNFAYSRIRYGITKLLLKRKPCAMKICDRTTRIFVLHRERVYKLLFLYYLRNYKNKSVISIIFVVLLFCFVLFFSFFLFYLFIFCTTESTLTLIT